MKPTLWRSLLETLWLLLLRKLLLQIRKLSASELTRWQLLHPKLTCTSLALFLLQKLSSMALCLLQLQQQRSRWKPRVKLPSMLKKLLLRSALSLLNLLRLSMVLLLMALRLLKVTLLKLLLLWLLRIQMRCRVQLWRES